MVDPAFEHEDVLAQMTVEDEKESSPLFGIVDITRMGLAGHSAGGAASLFAIDGSCQFPFCGPPNSPFPLPFLLPDAVRAGAFYDVISRNRTIQWVLEVFNK